MTLSAPIGFRDATLCGSGATSRVFRAVDAQSGRIVALKRLHRELVRSPEALARLRRELHSLDRLRHPAIVPVHDVVSWDGDPTIVMDYIDGEDLQQLLVRRGPLPADEVESIARQLLDVLAAVHGAGIVHRDLKPQNVRITPDGRLFLLDFGSARLDAASQLTRTGTTVGTPEYMAPELFAGSVYDPRVDIYGLGATIFAVLAGRPPQPADSLAELAFRRSHERSESIATARPDCPWPLQQLVDRCLATDPNRRYATAGLALWALDNPRLERLYQARRAQLPLCLDCHAPLAPDSTVCPSCKSPQPFSYAAGPAHVEIHAAEDPTRLIERIALELPERAQPEQLRSLTQRCAALSLRPARYVSYIDRDQARRLVDELGAIGVHAKVVERRGRWLPQALATIPLAGVVLLALDAQLRGAGWVLGAVALVLAIGFARRLWPIVNPASVVGRSLCPPQVAPRLLSAGFVGIAALLALGLTTTLPDRYEQLIGAQGAYALLLAAFAALTLLGFAFPVGRRGAGTLEPSLLDRLGAHLAAAEPRKPGSPARASGGARVLFLLVFVALVPLELSLLLRFDSALAQQRFAPAAARPAARPGTPLEPAPAPAPRAPARVTRSVHASPAMAIDVEWVKVGAACAPLLLVALLLPLSFRRWRRLRRDARAIWDDLDHEQLSWFARRQVPRERRPRARRGDGVAHQLAQLDTRTGFTHEAVQRAVDLAHQLPREAAESLRQALLELDVALDADGGADAPLLARCVQETDLDFAARLRFLELEGRLEAEAAAAWAAALAGEVSR